MTFGRLTALVAILTSLALSGGAAGACEKGQTCDAGTSVASAAEAPLKLSTFRKQPPRRPAQGKAAAAESGSDIAASTAAIALPPPVDPDDGWLASVYGMDPSLRPAANANAAGAVRVVEPGEFNEIDAAADAVRVVAAEDMNEIDAAAGTVGQGAADATPASDAHAAAATGPGQMSWIGSLLIALGGAVAAASALRLFVG